MDTLFYDARCPLCRREVAMLQMQLASDKAAELSKAQVDALNAKIQHKEAEIARTEKNIEAQAARLEAHMQKRSAALEAKIEAKAAKFEEKVKKHAAKLEKAAAQQARAEEKSK